MERPNLKHAKLVTPDMKVMKTNALFPKTGWATALGCLVLVLASWGPWLTCQGQSDPANLPPGVQDVLKLTRAGLSEDLILTQVKTAGATYTLTADQIIYLSNQGVSQNVIKALLPAPGSAQPGSAWQSPVPPQTAPAYAPAPSAPAYVPPAPAPNYAPGAPYAPAPVAAVSADAASPPPSYDYFQAQLQPYGRWVDIFGVGPCWVPAQAADPLWRPYFNSGHWVFTDQGWFWQSDYPWGEIAFHYGRWIRDINYGWVWVPAYDWAPAWVAWRYAEADGCCGWAPLPLEARFDARLGLCWHGGVALDVDFGLQMNAFVFIGFGNFWVHDYRTVIIGPERVRYFYGRSVVHNGYRMEHGRFVSEGIGRDRMASLTHRDIKVAAAHELRATEEHRNIQNRVAEHPRLAETAQHHLNTASHATATRPTTTARREESAPASREARTEPGSSSRPSSFSSPGQTHSAFGEKSATSSREHSGTPGSSYNGSQHGGTVGGARPSGSSEKQPSNQNSK